MSSTLPPSLTTMFERNQEATVYVGNLDLRVTEDIVWELFIQCGPVVNIHIPRDKITGDHQGFAFVEFRGEEDADYAIKIMHMIKLYGKPIKVNKASQDKRTQEVGANLFVGNLSEEIDEKGLKDIFTTFGVVLSTKINRDPESGNSKGYGFVSFDNFDSSDEAIKKLNGQYISGKPIEVSYAYKKDSKSGEKHGSVAERILAANRPATTYTPSPFESQTQSTLTSFPSMMNTNYNMNMMNPSNVNPPVVPPNILPQNVPVPSTLPKLPPNMGIVPGTALPMNVMRPPTMPPVRPPNIPPK